MKLDVVFFGVLDQVFSDSKVIVEQIMQDWNFFSLNIFSFYINNVIGLQE